MALSADKLNVFLLMAEFGLLGGLMGTFRRHDLGLGPRTMTFGAQV